MGRFARFALLACLLAAPAGAAPLQGTPSRLPVGYWKLDEGAGPTAVASIGTLNGTWNGTIGTVTTPLPPLSYNNQGGVTSRAISLAGAQPDDFIEIANGPALQDVQEGSYTLSAWIRPASVPPGVDAAWNAAYGILIKAGYHEGLVYGNGQHAQFDHWATGNAWAGTGSWATGFIVPANTAWAHVAAVWDRDADQVRVYVDGVLRGQGAAPNDNRDYAANPWRIGIAYAGAGADYAWPFDGLIDDVRIYGIALTAEEVDILADGVPTPGAFTAAGTVQSVTLTWTAPATPPAYPFTYNISRSVDGGAFTPLAGNVSGTSYVDTTAITTNGLGPSYTYQITAVSVAESGTVTSNSATPVLPEPRTSGNDEGLLGDRCACGSTIARPLGLLAAALAALGLLILRR